MTVADDHQALVWDTQPRPQPIEVPILAYAAEGMIKQDQWSSAQSDMIMHHLLQRQCWHTPPLQWSLWYSFNSSSQMYNICKQHNCYVHKGWPCSNKRLLIIVVFTTITLAAVPVTMFYYWRVNKQIICPCGISSVVAEISCCFPIAVEIYFSSVVSYSGFVVLLHCKQLDRLVQLYVKLY